MIRRRDGWSIVLAGFWNRSLFLPEWVGPRLFPEPGMEIEIALLPAPPSDLSRSAGLDGNRMGPIGVPTSELGR